jgi:transposase
MRLRMRSASRRNPIQFPLNRERPNREDANKIQGCDYHPGFQQIAFVDTDTGEAAERRVTHREEAEQFYRALQARRVGIGMEASGHGRWFERLLNELQFELGIGDAAENRTKRVRKQKTDRRDAQLLLKLLMEDRFPRIWVPDAEHRDLRQLLWHRHRLVQMRTRIMNRYDSSDEIFRIHVSDHRVEKVASLKGISRNPDLPWFGLANDTTIRVHWH